MRRFILIASLMLGGVAMVGCQTEPTPATDNKKDALANETQAAVSRIKTDVPNFETILNDAYGYAIFPNVGKGGLVVGG